MLELVVVVAVLAILAAIAIPFFQSLIKQAAYVAGKWTLASARTSCAANKTLPIPIGFGGTQFSSSKPSDVCSGVLTATHVDGCQLSIDLENGVRTSTAGSGWPETYEVCELGIQIADNPEQTVEPVEPVQDKEDWQKQTCSEEAKDIVPEYMSKGDRRFLRAYEVLRKWYIIDENISKAESLPNTQTRGNTYHNFQLDRDGGLKTHEFVNGNVELKDELERSVSEIGGTSEYSWDIWMNPPNATTGRPTISVRRLGPEGYWRVAGHELKSCKSSQN